MKILLSFLIFSVSVFAADPKSITVIVDGKTYQCSEGNAGATDPQCASKLAAWCTSNTQHNSESCFKIASTNCKKKGPAFFECVSSSAASCNKNTNQGANKCLDAALDDCK